MTTRSTSPPGVAAAESEEHTAPPAAADEVPLASSHPFDPSLLCGRFAARGECCVVSCPYAHTPATEERPMPVDVCRFFAAGQCLRLRCDFLHGTEAQLQELRDGGAAVYRPAALMRAVDPLTPLPDDLRQAHERRVASRQQSSAEARSYRRTSRRLQKADCRGTATGRGAAAFPAAVARAPPTVPMVALSSFPAQQTLAVSSGPAVLTLRPEMLPPPLTLAPKMPTLPHTPALPLAPLYAPFPSKGPIAAPPLLGAPPPFISRPGTICGTGGLPAPVAATPVHYLAPFQAAAIQPPALQPPALLTGGFARPGALSLVAPPLPKGHGAIV